MSNPTDPTTFEDVAKEFATDCMKRGVPPAIVIGGMAGVALDIAINTQGIQAARAWLRDIVRLVDTYEQGLQ